MAEELLWQRLRNRQLNAKFRRQRPIGPFIVDFYCAEARLVVEIDGDVHLEASRADRDQARTEWLEELGYRVLRFGNDEVMQNLEAVLEKIAGGLLPAPSRASRAERGAPAPRERGVG
jgi:adenine-specific DNA-methyltransferase